MSFALDVVISCVQHRDVDAIYALEAALAEGGCAARAAAESLLTTLHSYLLPASPQEVRVSSASALGALALYSPHAVCSVAGGSLVDMLGSSASAECAAAALVNVSCCEVSLRQLLDATPLVSLLLSALHRSGREGEALALARLCGNLTRVPAACCALARAGAVHALVHALRSQPAAAEPAAGALLDLCSCSQGPARACGRLLERSPETVAALVQASLGEGSEALALLQLLVDEGAFSPSALLSCPGSASAVAAILSLLRRSGRPPEGGAFFALACLAQWGGAEDGLAVLGSPVNFIPGAPPGPCVLALAVLSEHLPAAAGILAEQEEAVQALLEGAQSSERERSLAASVLRGLLQGVQGGAAGGRSNLKRARGLRGGSASQTCRALCSRLSDLAQGGGSDPSALTEAAIAGRDVPGSLGNLVCSKASQVQQTGTLSVRALGPWRVLRFDDTEQGLAYIPPGGFRGTAGSADPRILGLDYIRTMAAAAVGFSALPANASTPPSAFSSSSSSTFSTPTPALGRAGARVLCVGLGSGALPSFISHHFPTAAVEVLEIDPAVTACCAETLGLGGGLVVLKGVRERAQVGAVSVRHCDAGEWVAGGGIGGLGGGYTLLFFDPYERTGSMPSHLASPAFLAAAGGMMLPGGVIVANLWNGSPHSPRRRAMLDFCESLRAALGEGGRVFTVGVPGQPSNVVAVGIVAPSGAAGAVARSTARDLAEGARIVGRDFVFDPGALLLRDVFEWVGGCEVPLGSGLGTAVDLARFQVVGQE